MLASLLYYAEPRWCCFHQLLFEFKFTRKVWLGGKFPNKSRKFGAPGFIWHFPGYIGLNLHRAAGAGRGGYDVSN